GSTTVQVAAPCGAAPRRRRAARLRARQLCRTRAVGGCAEGSGVHLAGRAAGRGAGAVLRRGMRRHRQQLGPRLLGPGGVGGGADDRRPAHPRAGRQEVGAGLGRCRHRQGHRRPRAHDVELPGPCRCAAGSRGPRRRHRPVEGRDRRPARPRPL
ncbi:MAG: hypothetical protein AVDCRST_MAG47-233, partial [uncultured Nocardioidaceae bacterium]